MEEYDLSAYLAPAGKAPGIGPEKTFRLGDGVTLYTSPHGSFRYVLFASGKPVSVVQVVSAPLSNEATVSNVYTVPEKRRTGATKKLMKFVRKDFDEVLAPPKHLRSEDGDAWASGMFEPNKRIQVDFYEINNAAKQLVLALINAIDPMYFESTFGAVGGYWRISDVLGTSIYPTRVNIDGHVLDIEISAQTPPKTGNHSKFYLMGFASAPKKSKGSVPRVGIVLNGNVDIRAMKDWDFVTEIEGVLRHEVTHTLDPLVLKGLPRGYDDATPNADYANAMCEVKAFGNELIYVLQRQMQGMMCSRMGDAECNDILRTQLEREMAKYPYNLLTEKNRRRLYKDIYLSLTEDEEP
jgi:hypothetical protein